MPLLKVEELHDLPMLLVVYLCLPNLITISHCGYIYADLARNVARCREGAIPNLS